jgi:hypothetical protein
MNVSGIKLQPLNFLATSTTIIEIGTVGNKEIIPVQRREGSGSFVANSKWLV